MVIKSNEYKLKEGRFRLDMRKKILHGKGSQAMEQAAQGNLMVESPSLEVFKTCVGVELGDTI